MLYNWRGYRHDFITAKLAIKLVLKITFKRDKNRPDITDHPIIPRCSKTPSTASHSNNYQRINIEINETRLLFKRKQINPDESNAARFHDDCLTHLSARYVFDCLFIICLRSSKMNQNCCYLTHCRNRLKLIDC